MLTRYRARSPFTPETMTTGARLFVVFQEKDCDGNVEYLERARSLRVFGGNRTQGLFWGSPADYERAAARLEHLWLFRTARILTKEEQLSLRRMGRSTTPFLVLTDPSGELLMSVTFPRTPDAIKGVEMLANALTAQETRP